MSKLYLVGLGAGNKGNRTAEATAALAESDTIIGYSTYLTLIQEECAGKRCMDTPMKQEAERCRMAITEVLQGHTVSLVCSGDSGVYGMASLVFEVAQDYPPIAIEVISGVTAACSGAAVLGAPLTHDFAVISLSDLLTPWERIAKRLSSAAAADFVICLYNPSSKKRADYLQRACQIVMQYQKKDTACGYVRQIGRAGEEAKILTLEQLQWEAVDMFTTVFIGNSETKVLGNRLVTPRGYRL